MWPRRDILHNGSHSLEASPTDPNDRNGPNEDGQQPESPKEGQLANSPSTRVHLSTAIPKLKMPARGEDEVEEVKYALGVVDEGPYVVCEKIGNCSGHYVVREGYRKRQTPNTGADYWRVDDHDLAFITFVGLGDGQKRALERLGRAEAALSDEACFAHVLRYKDYLGSENHSDAANHNKARTAHADLFNSLVTEHTDWKGIDPRAAAMSDREILDVAWDMLQALAYLHGRGVVHGSVEPRHILHLRGGCPPGPERRETYKLIGHGLVPHVLRDWSFPEPLYVAPEFHRRREGGNRGRGEYKPTMASDVWMLGLVLFELHEFGRGDRLQRSRSGVLKGHDAASRLGGLKRSRRCDAGHSSRFHKVLEDLLERMLQNGPGSRYTAMNALLWLAEERIMLYEAGDVRDQVQPVKDAIKRAKYEMRMRTVRGRAWVGLKSFVVSLFLVQMVALGMGVF
ncbi:hypothetical protein CkaCkLH20_04604 [Colletotrichum karsti]|uniref:Protein kinase domain-containing protein n=1 Tax=Colletotrichum karsti TaxID=1095194 RepID=A0A9P6I7Y6_9PEZI|nr:uncharacterized protein CkaCkLH20_04604 [Colletotrichum karsti]KAF9878028.1 hypothetical protein CkaCkLH20_04604 [Colletotrichum karsti]